jgi:hypothetical protein
MQRSTTADLVQNATSSGGGGWSSPDQRELLGRVRAFTPEQRAAALAATRARFTPDDLRRFEERQREYQKLIARVAATETLEQAQQLAEELFPRFDDWVRGRNQIQSTPTRQPRLVAVIRPRNGQRDREHRPAQTRRAASSSSTSSSDPGDPDPASAGAPPRVGDLRNVHDRVSILRREVASGLALLRSEDLAGGRFRNALDVADDLLRDLERFGVAR